MKNNDVSHLMFSWVTHMALFIGLFRQRVFYRHKDLYIVLLTAIQILTMLSPRNFAYGIYAVMTYAKIWCFQILLTWVQEQQRVHSSNVNHE